jgi:pilus assembly protein CpaB
MKTLLLFAGRVWAAVRARRTAWMALGALAFGAMAVLGARNYIGDRVALEKARLQPRHEMVELVVAKRDLRRGDVVGPESMAVRSVPREYAPGAAVVPGRFDALSGSKLLVPMKAGEPLLPNAVASVESAAISSRLRPGIRAMTIAVDEVNSLSGMLQPGDRIDLMLSVRPPAVAGIAQPEVTRTVMQGVAVMATGRQARASLGDEPVTGRSYTSITVEVDPDQAQRLVVAQRSGKLTAVLRNPEDHRLVVEKRLDVNMLLGIPAPQAAAPSRSGPEVIVGGRGSVSPSPGAATPGAATAVTEGAGAPGSSSAPLRAADDAPPAAGAPPEAIGARGAAPPPRGLRPLSPVTPMPPVPLWGAGRPTQAADGAGRGDAPAQSGEGVWVPLEPPATVPLYR